MDAGKLKHRIQIWGKVKFTSELLEEDFKDGVLKTIWSEIIPQTGSLQRVQADTILTTCTHKIIVRYDAGKDIEEDMWILYKGHRFDIKYILNPYFRNEKLEIFVEDVTT